MQAARTWFKNLLLSVPPSSGTGGMRPRQPIHVSSAAIIFSGVPLVEMGNRNVQKYCHRQEMLYELNFLGKM